MEPKSLRKKFKTPGFAAGVNRTELLEGFRLLSEQVGGSEDEHFQRVVDVLHRHREILGLLPA